MIKNESLLKRTFGVFSSKRKRVFVIASFFVIFGVFVVFKPTFAGLSEIALGFVGQITMLWVWLMGQLIALITYVLIAIANYNSFSSSEAISVGWVIIRDICNMFFVIIFLVIAFGTILGARDFHYSSTLPRLLLMAILINFSKTIAGLIIDFGQVIMMTFVNGFSTAAGGNFLEILQIQHLTEIRTLPGDTTIDQWDAVGGLILAAIVATVSVIVMATMAIVLVFRVVMLWLLVVLSPLAFFSAAVPSGSISGYYGKWWTKFTKEVIVGPILAFFIWLSLAVVSSVGAEGNEIARGATIEENVEIASGSASDESVSALSAGIGDESVMLKYLIGLGMLVGGLILAQEVGAAGSGVAGSAYGWMKSKSVGFAKKAGGYAWQPAGYALQQGKAGAARAGKATVEAGVKIPLAASKWSLRQIGIPQLADKARREIAGALAKSESPSLSSVGIGLTRGISEVDKQREEKAEKKIAHLDTVEDLKARRNAVKRIKNPSADAEAELHVLNKKLYGKLGFQASSTENAKLVKSIEEDLKDRQKVTGEFVSTQELHKSRPDLMVDKDEMRGLIKDMTDADINKINIKAFDKDSEGGKAVLEALSEREDITKSKFISRAKRDEIEKYQNIKKGIVEITKENFKSMKPQQIEAALEDDTLKVGAIEVSDLEVNNGALAGQIAEFGSDELKEALMAKNGKEYLSALEANKKANRSADPNGYNKPTMILSKEILKSGGGVKNSFNIDINGNFGVDDRGGEDLVSFERALDKNKGGDPTLALNVKAEEFKGQVKDIIKDVLYDQDDLRKISKLARSEDEKDSLEIIVQGIYEKAKEINDNEMMNFLERTRGIKNNIPNEMKRKRPQRTQT